jgi:hypothetical protein
MGFGSREVVHMDSSTSKVIFVRSFCFGVQGGVSIADGRAVKLPCRGEFGENSMIEIKDRKGDGQAKDEGHGRRNKPMTSFDFPTCPIATFRQTSIAAQAPRMAHPSSHQWSDK